jgi:hypothetical protein
MNNKGQALLIVISVVSIAFISTALAISLGFLNVYRAEAMGASQKAFYGAESGLERGLVGLNNDFGYSGEEFVQDGCSVTVSVEEIAPGLYVILSKGEYNGNLRQLELEVDEDWRQLERIEWREVY